MGKVSRNSRGCYGRLRFLHVLEASMAYPGLLRSLRFPDILKSEGSWRRFFGIPGAAMLGFVFFMFLEGSSAYPGLLHSLRFLIF